MNFYEKKELVKPIWRNPHLTSNQKYVAVYLLLGGEGKPIETQAKELGLTEDSLKLYIQSLSKIHKEDKHE